MDDLISRKDAVEHIKKYHKMTSSVKAILCYLETAPAYINSYDLGYADGKKVTLQAINDSFNNGFEMGKLSTQQDKR